MYHALVMGMLESASGLQAYLNGPSPGETFVPAKLPVKSVRDELHDDVGDTVFYLEIMNPSDVGMV
jgi:hypothetical protein